MSEPREWWLADSCVITKIEHEGFKFVQETRLAFSYADEENTVSGKRIPVIEKSAYDQLAEENKALNEKRLLWSDQAADLHDENKALKAENEKYWIEIKRLNAIVKREISECDELKATQAVLIAEIKDHLSCHGESWDENNKKRRWGIDLKKALSQITQKPVAKSNNYKCTGCGFEGPCYGQPTSKGVTAPWCPVCERNDAVEKIYPKE